MYFQAEKLVHCLNLSALNNNNDFGQGTK